MTDDDIKGQLSKTSQRIKRLYYRSYIVDNETKDLERLIAKYEKDLENDAKESISINNG